MKRYTKLVFLGKQLLIIKKKKKQINTKCILALNYILYSLLFIIYLLTVTESPISTTIIVIYCEYCNSVNFTLYCIVYTHQVFQLALLLSLGFNIYHKYYYFNWVPIT